MTRKQGDGTPVAMSLSEVGDVLGVSGERVRQIEVSALNKIRRNLALMGITAVDLVPEPEQNRPADETEFCTQYSSSWIK